MTAPLSLHDQIELTERRVRIDKLHLKMAMQGVRESARAVVSSPVSLVAVFLATSIVGAVAGRKLVTKRRTRRSTW
jgi:multidrug efflux pump subunit AcrB